MTLNLNTAAGLCFSAFTYEKKLSNLQSSFLHLVWNFVFTSFPLNKPSSPVFPKYWRGPQVRNHSFGVVHLFFHGCDSNLTRYTEIESCGYYKELPNDSEAGLYLFLFFTFFNRKLFFDVGCKVYLLDPDCNFWD